MISPVITARPLGEDITYFPPETQHLTVSVICEKGGGSSDDPYQVYIRIKKHREHTVERCHPYFTARGCACAAVFPARLHVWHEPWGDTAGCGQQMPAPPGRRRISRLPMVDGAK